LNWKKFTVYCIGSGFDFQFKTTEYISLPFPPFVTYSHSHILTLHGPVHVGGFIVRIRTNACKSEGTVVGVTESEKNTRYFLFPSLLTCGLTKIRRIALSLCFVDNFKISLWPTKKTVIGVQIAFTVLSGYLHPGANSIYCVVWLFASRVQIASVVLSGYLHPGAISHFVYLTSVKSIDALERLLLFV
jgi:hypothetical protein